jgi:hypothetical protein
MKPTRTAFQVNGKRVPSVSSIAGQLDKPGLVFWAHGLGLKGVQSIRDHRDKDQRAGVLAHEILLGWLKGDGKSPMGELYENLDISEYTPEEIETSKPILERAADLVDAEISPVKTSFIEESFVSEEYLFGGRIDWYGMINGDGPMALVDFKTSKGIYPDNIIQISAYWGLLRENKLYTDRVMIVRVGTKKEEGEEICTLTDAQLSAGWKTFLLLRQIYDLKKTVEGDIAKTRKAA